MSVMNFMRARPARQNHGKLRSEVAQIARERIGILLVQAKEKLSQSPELSRRYVELARKTSMRTKVRIPKESKHYLCKNCGLPMVLGTNARLRLRPGNQRIIISCLSCGAIRRYPYDKAR